MNHLDGPEFLPWITYPAIDFLRNRLHPEHDIFEFGGGASTIFFAQHASSVISIEHDPVWHKLIIDKLLEYKLKKKARVILSHPETFESAIEPYQNRFDFILIDSMKRFLCAQKAIHAIKAGGSIILDDSERKNYRKIFEFMEKSGFSRSDFYGEVPGGPRPKNTTLFTKSA